MILTFYAPICSIPITHLETSHKYCKYFCFPVGYELNRNPGLDLVDTYFRRSWLDELAAAMPVVKSMLNIVADERPSCTSDWLKHVFPAVLASVKEWLHNTHDLVESNIIDEGIIL